MNAPFQVGELLGGCYRLTRLLARGGMSHVFEADDSLLSRRVAIKVVDDAALGATMLVGEARALAAVRDRGLPAVHAIGTHRGWTYLVLERLYGVDLETHLAGPNGPKQLDPHEALPILAALAQVLSSVHRAGMSHRDLKPGNVMLCAERVVLLDFGIVVPLVAAGSAPRSGTPRYLAPEVIRSAVDPGRAHLVDVYAFGTVAFEMLAGRPPFVAEGVVAMLEHQLRTPPPDLAALRPDLPRALVALIGACLAKDPAERPGDMEAIAWELRSLWRRLVGASGPVRMTPGQSPTRETYRRAVDSERGAAPKEILIVEDDEDIRDSLAELLTSRGFRTRVAADGRDALEMIRSKGRRPSLILLDLMMPVLDGQGFLQHKAADPTLDGIPVVLVTAQPSEAARARFPSVQGVVPKPLETGALLQLINQVCAR